MDLPRLDEITILWHMNFFDGILSGIGETTYGRKVYLKCYDEGVPIWGITNNRLDKLPSIIKEYMKNHNISRVEDFPEELTLDGYLIIRWDAEESDSGQAELEIEVTRKYYVYELSEAEFDRVLKVHQLFQKYIGTHTDYPRGTVNPNYLSNLDKFKNHELVKTPAFSTENKEPIGHVYGSNLKVPRVSTNTN